LVEIWSTNDEYGVFICSLRVCASMIFGLSRSSGAMAEAPLRRFFGLAIRRRVKRTSLAVRALPLWNVTPSRRRIVHSVESALAVISSARSFETFLPSASSATRPL
jgi:hypothetical protein